MSHKDDVAKTIRDTLQIVGRHGHTQEASIEATLAFTGIIAVELANTGEQLEDIAKSMRWLSERTE